MKYDITKPVAPAMPNLGKGTEFCKLLLSQASKDMRETLVPMAIPALAAHLSEVEFMYSDNKYYELCGQMGHLIGPSGIGKAQLTSLIEAIQRSFRDHDEVEYKRLADLTNPAFIQNAMALEKQGGRTLFARNREVWTWGTAYKSYEVACFALSPDIPTKFIGTNIKILVHIDILITILRLRHTHPLTRILVGINKRLWVFIDEVDTETAHFKAQIEEAAPREEREDRVAHTHYADS